MKVPKKVAEEIKKTYDAYNEEESKASANLKEKDIKKYAKTIKKMLSTTFMPKYSVNKVIDEEKIKDYELVYDEEFYRKLK